MLPTYLKLGPNIEWNTLIMLETVKKVTAKWLELLEKPKQVVPYRKIDYLFIKDGFDIIKNLVNFR